MGLIRHPFNISDILVWSLKDSRNFVFILINILKLQIQEIKGNQATTKQRQVKKSIFLTAQKAGPYVYMFVQLSNTQTELGVCGEALLRVHIVSNNFASHSAASLGFRASGHRRYVEPPRQLRHVPRPPASAAAHLPAAQNTAAATAAVAAGAAAAGNAPKLAPCHGHGAVRGTAPPGVDGEQGRGTGDLWGSMQLGRPQKILRRS
jgi:hypothetical protein